MTEVTKVRGFQLSGDALPVAMALPFATIAVPVGKGSGLFNVVDITKLPDAVRVQAFYNGIAKALADASDPGGEASDLKAIRDKRIATWYGGDWAGKGGGSPDPLAATMREVAVSRIHKAVGGTRAEAEKRVTGKLADWINGVAEAKVAADAPERSVAVTAAAQIIATGLEKEARALIAKRAAEAAKRVEPANLADLF